MNKFQIFLKRFRLKRNGVYTNYDDKKKLKHIDEIVSFNKIEEFDNIITNEAISKIERKDHPVKLFLMNLDEDKSLVKK